MKLTKQDIKYLIDIGYYEQDIPQIKRAKKVLRLRNDNGEKISQDKAVEVLGRENFLSSLGRCAFHWTACNENNGYIVYFDASKLFEDEEIKK